MNIGGWTLQYGPANGGSAIGDCSHCKLALPASAVIAACGYYLIQLYTNAPAPSPLPVPPDLAAPAGAFANMSAGQGILALKSDAGSAPCAPLSDWVDLAGYGAAV